MHGLNDVLRTHHSTSPPKAIVRTHQGVDEGEESHVHQGRPERCQSRGNETWRAAISVDSPRQDEVDLPNPIMYAVLSCMNVIR